MDTNLTTYGVGDASFQAAGGESGLAQLVDDFYQAMDLLPEAAPLRALYPADLSLAKEKLATFLVGWLGGPRLYQAKFGHLHIPSFHTQWQIDQAQSQRWLGCMQHALSLQPYEPAFKEYLLTQLKVPAARIEQACANKKPQTP